MDSILTSIKKRLGIVEEYTHFDEDIIMDINTTFGILNQMGVGPEEGYRIEDSMNTWDEFTDDNLLMEPVKTYVFLKVRTMFDPPTSSIMAESVNKRINELEWRLYALCDYKEKNQNE